MSEIVSNSDFCEKLFKEKCKRTALKLYRENKVKDLPKYTPRDVLKLVSSQLKAIQQADNVKAIKVDNKLGGSKESCTHNVNKLPVYKEVQKHNTKFETQCVSDTQLIELMQNIEENVINTDMVEEFYTSFDNMPFEEEVNDNKNISTCIETKGKITISEKVSHNDDMNTITKYCSSRNLGLEEDASNNIELATNSSKIKQAINYNDNKLHVNKTCSTQKDFSTDKNSHDMKINKKYIECHIQPNFMNDNIITKRDLDNIESVSNVNPLKKVVFMSLDLNRDDVKYIDTCIPECDTAFEVRNSKLIPDLEQVDCLEDNVNIPLSIILNDKKETKKKTNKNYVGITDKNTNNYKKGGQHSTTKEIFTEHCDNCSIDFNNQAWPVDSHTNILKETNFKLNTKTMTNEDKNMLQTNKKETISVKEQLCTEDFNSDFDIKENKNTVSSSCSIFKESILRANRQELYDITLDNFEMEFDHNLKNVIELKDCTNNVIINDTQQKGDKINKEQQFFLDTALRAEASRTVLQTHISEDIILNTNIIELVTQDSSFVERQNIKQFKPKNTKVSKDDCDISHVEVVRTCEDNIQIKQIDYLQPEKISNIHVEEIGAKTIPSKSEYNCRKKTFKDRELTQFESKARTTEEKETNKTSAVDNINLLDLGRNSRSTSPIFNTKITKTKPYTPPDLVFDLESFEKFENLAFSLISTTKDLEVVKQLVNSQILNKELYLYGNENICLGDAPSPLFETEKYVKINHKERDLKPSTDDNSLFDDISKINQSQTYKSYKENYTNILKGKLIINDTPKTETNAFHNEKQSKYIEDEILFSSDEESEYVHQDLPLTCAIGTSFDNKSEVLDKTMYVGFETASKKIIQISTDSYVKAKSIMSIGVEGKSLNDLVTLIDSRSKSDDTNKVTRPQTPDINKTETHKQNNYFINMSKDMTMDKENIINPDRASTNLSETDFNNCKVDMEDGKTLVQTGNRYNSTEKALVKRPYKGFVVANNKKIKLSDIAFAKCKNVFKDIGLDEQFKPQDTVSLEDIQNNSTFWTNDVEVTKDIYVSQNNISDFNNFTDSNIKITNEDQTCAKDFINTDINNFENMAQINITDELIIKEFENVEMLLHEKEDDINEFKNSDSNKLEINDDKPCEIPLVDETEALLENVGLSKVVDNKYINKITENNNSITKKYESQDKHLIEAQHFQQFNSRHEGVNESRHKTSDVKDLKISNKIEFDGFKTASNKYIKISDSALINSRKIFSDIDLGDPREFQTNIEPQVCKDKVQSNNLSNYIGSHEGKSPPKGFQTVSDEPIRILKKSLHKTKNIFNDPKIVNTVFNDNVSDSMIYGPRKTNWRDLQTINNKSEVKKYDNTLRHTELDGSNETTKEILKTIMTEDSQKIGMSHSDGRGFMGFQTANNKPVTITKEALKNTKHIFKDILVDSLNNDDRNDLNSRTDKVKKSSLKGFQTANNKPVEVSNEALQRTKDMFNNSDIPKTSKEVTENNAKDNEAQIPTFKGFRTANNEPVKISTEALLRSKNIFQDININEDFCDSSNASNTNIENINFQGFKTASNKKVAISKEALEKYKHIFDDINITAEFDELGHGISSQFCNKKETCIKNKYENLDLNIDHKNNAFKASNISETDKVENPSFQALQRKNIDIPKTSKEVIENNTKDNAQISTFKGFRTANNEPVKISTEALLRSKNIFQDTNVNENISGNFNASNTDTEKINFQGFKTASNKKVAISKEALERCKNIFDNINMTSEFDELVHPIPSQYTNKEESCRKNEYECLDLNIDHKNNASRASTIADKTYHRRLSELLSRNKNVNTLSSDNAYNVESETQKYHRKNSKHSNNELSKITQNEGSVSIDKECNKVSIKQVDADFNIEQNANKILNTQLLNNFESTLYTEDFHITPPKINRRSGSPILSCPKAKKRKKFEVPYRTDPFMKNNVQSPANLNIENQKKYQFDNNYKKHKRYLLRDLMNIEAELKLNNSNNNYDDVKTLNHLEDIDLKTFIFRQDRNDLYSNKISVRELKTIFENSVDKKIIPDNWFENHMKMILWKFFEYENKFPNSMKHVCRVTNVLEQLKYRYDIELHNAARPTLRRILEKDDIPSKLMVLRVAGIYVDDAVTYSVTNPTPNIELLLTDGWYAIKSSVDKMMASLICSKKIGIGTKLATWGAELLNCEQGISPWEDTSSVRLKLHGNSTRRARWDARLGFYGNGAILATLGSVKVDGGKIAQLRVYVTRVYPALYVEKFDDASTVTRSERLENLHQMKFENERTVIFEKLYEEVEKEISDHESEDSPCTMENSSKRRCLETGSQIAKTMNKCMDPLEFHNHLTPTQQKLLEEHMIKRREKLLEDIQKRVREKIKTKGLCVNRNVIQLLKIRVVGVENKNGVEVTKGVLSIWKPNDDILDLIEEGIWIDVTSVVPTAIRLSEIHLSAGRQSVFKKYTPKNDRCKHYLDIYKRQALTVSELVARPSTEYNEIDTVGVVIDIEPNLEEFDAKKHTFQNVYLTDENKNIVSVNFWGGLKKCGYENMFEIGQIVCGINLHERLGKSRKTILSYRLTEFSYFTKTPKYKNLKLILDNLYEKMTGVDIKKLRAECLSMKNKYTSKVYNNENMSPFRSGCNNITVNHNIVAQNSSIFNHISNDFDLSGLDFDSTFKQSEQQDISPKLSQRKRQISEKIAKLKMYGEPPPLNQIYIINKSKNASNNYKTPFLSENYVCDRSSVEKFYNKTNSTTTEISNESIKHNIGLNTKYMKTDPVIINIMRDQSNVSEIVDPFSEEFDGSLPLSLD